PPYNTGKDFIYRDNFKEPLKDYLEKTGQIDSEGSKLTTNTEASGRYHSDWLNFMYPRLFLARSLLRDDGVIFVSIDDHEVHHLRKIMDEIFGEENFISNFIWKKKAGGGSDAKYVADDHEYILIYTKNENQLPRFFIKMSDELKKEYKYKDQYFNERGPYKRKNLHQTGIETDRPNLIYPIQAPDGAMVRPPTIWRWSKERFKKAKSEGRIDFVKDSNGKWKVHTKMYLYEGGEERQVKPRSILDNVGFTRDGNKDITEIFGKKVYDYPKPVSLIEHLIPIVISPENRDIVLDFFAGSGTTGHAVWDLNREDGGNRKFIIVNLDEEVQDENIKMDYPTVADICIERLRRVSEKYNEEEQQKLTENDQDFGFKVFRLDKSNFNLKDEFEIYEGADAEELKKKYLDWLSLWINEPLVGDWKPIDIV
ncbi:MAG: site-specific DNA-methyltransferase, partial [Methanophagales archaeon]|nr:site-specific DNA-methyltransferase [Methanophagales archaeon]